MFVVPPPSIRPWTPAKRETLATYRIFSVDHIDWTDSSGTPRGDAYVIRCADWCNVIALTPDGHVVLVWQYRYGTDSMSLEIPGGVIDPGEDPATAATRELREETGYVADSLEPLLVIEPNPATQSNRCHTFVARNALRTQATAFDAMEELETVLVPVDRIPDLLDGGQIRHSLVQGALERFWRRRQRPR